MSEELVAMLKAENQRLKFEVITLKWIIAQALQRWTKNNFAIFYKANVKKFGIMVKDVPQRKEIHVSIKEIVDEPANPSGRPVIN